MKTYTITCHDVYNYGASLQAFALQKYLQKEGIDNKIIDYMPDYLSWHYHFRWWISPRGSHYSLLKKCAPLRFCYVLLRLFKDMRSLGRKRAFDEFVSSNMVLTERCTSVDEIHQCTKNADVLIAGSDQIWNSYSLENGSDKAFYLSFGPSNAKRISYAASFGVNAVKERDYLFVKEQLSKFICISVREDKGQVLLSEMGFKSDVVVDPVFLLDKNDWEKFPFKAQIQGDYILLYAIGSFPESMNEMAKKISMETGYQLICIRSNKAVKNVKEIKNAGPSDFVGLINNASYILSNSFHATAFSIIFEKEFYSFSYGSQKTSERIVNLLHLVGLDNRYNPKSFCTTDSIDYKTVKQTLNRTIDSSKEWLRKALL